ncbi:cation:proton antiporter, partial [Bacteroidota bacterium]
DWKGGLFVGFLAALSSTAIVLKLLQERSELTSNYGRTVLGILIFQDLLLVPLILFTHIIGGEDVNVKSQLISLFIKAIAIIGLVYIGNKWIMPKLLHIIALTKNQELFMMSIFLICLSIALLTSELGMSLAFGAFLAGLMISGSEYSHNAFGNLKPFKDTFSSFFFVSIGMLLDLSFVINNFKLIIITVLLVIFIKTIIAGGTAFMLGHTFRGTVMVGLTLSQVGEFSFILAKIGLNYSILSSYYYQLFLAVAIITMSGTPFLIQIAKPLSNFILKLPLPRFMVDGLFPLKEIEVPQLKNHLVIIGKDIRAQKLSVMSKHLNIPYISVIFDPEIVRERQIKGENVIYGDAVNEPILLKAYTDTADIVVISVGDIIASMAIVEKVRNLNKHAYILVRAKYIRDIDQLYKFGADEVVPEKFEIAIEMFSRILSKRLFLKRDINRVLAKIREDYYGIIRDNDAKYTSSILDEIPNLEITALKIDDSSPVIGKSIVGLQLRKVTGVTLLALKRKEKIVEHPVPETIFQKEDIVYIIGKPEQIINAMDLFLKE